LKRANKCIAGQQHQLTSCCQIRAIEIGITRTSGQRIVLVWLTERDLQSIPKVTTGKQFWMYVTGKC